MVPDNRRQAQSLSLSGEVSLSWSRPHHTVGPPQHRPLLHSASGPHADLDTGEVTASAKLTKLQELQDKKQTMDKILQELHSLRDQTLNNNSCIHLFILLYLQTWCSLTFRKCWWIVCGLPQVVACQHSSVQIEDYLQITHQLSAQTRPQPLLPFSLCSHSRRALGQLTS